MRRQHGTGRGRHGTGRGRGGGDGRGTGQGGGAAGAEKPPEAADFVPQGKPEKPAAGTDRPPDAAPKPKPARTIFAHPGKAGKDDAWRAYGEGGCLKYDPKGERFWGEVARITGRNLKDWAAFTAEDWQECIDVFMMQG